jgi:7-carboxy-7-deazaguanine synthase
VKFVICDRADFDWSVEMLQRFELTRRCEVLFSPSFGQQDATALAEWVLAAQLPVRMQVQLHKYLWGNAPGH